MYMFIHLQTYTSIAVQVCIHTGTNKYIWMLVRHDPRVKLTYFGKKNPCEENGGNQVMMR